MRGAASEETKRKEQGNGCDWEAHLGARQYNKRHRTHTPLCPLQHWLRRAWGLRTAGLHQKQKGAQKGGMGGKQLCLAGCGRP